MHTYAASFILFDYFSGAVVRIRIDRALQLIPKTLLSLLSSSFATSIHPVWKWIVAVTEFHT